MKVAFLKRYNKVIAYLLTFLGLGSACAFSGCMYGAGPEMYGTPSATFRVYGKVLSEDSAGIPLIRVVISSDTMYSGPEGNYTISKGGFPDSQEFQIEFTDMDGAENGNWQNLDTTVAFVNPKFKGGDGDWYHGETSQEFNVKLMKKE
jgi:putative lipoprotein (rSAM/lipoprotein system)